MNEELRKKLEEAVKTILKIIHNGELPWYHASEEKAIRCGAEYGYKEAIEMAKEWLLENTISHYNPDTDARWVDTNECEDNKEFVYRFESDMNKLWEEEK